MGWRSSRRTSAESFSRRRSFLSLLLVTPIPQTKVLFRLAHAWVCFGMKVLQDKAVRGAKYKTATLLQLYYDVADFQISGYIRGWVLKAIIKFLDFDIYEMVKPYGEHVAGIVRFSSFYSFCAVHAGFGLFSTRHLLRRSNLLYRTRF